MTDKEKQELTADARLIQAETALSNLVSENIGANARTEIQWRKQWVERLTECEQFFTKYLRDPAPYHLVYSPELQPGAIDWNKETLDIGFELGFYAEDPYFEILQNAVNAVKIGLDETGRAERWKLNWPSESIAQTNPFVGKNENINLSVELLNASQQVIGRVSVTLPYGYTVDPQSKTFSVRPLGDTWQSLSFKEVDANGAIDPLILHVASIDGVPANQAAQTRRISIAAEANMDALRKRITSFRETYPGGWAIMPEGEFFIQTAHAYEGFNRGFWDLNQTPPIQQGAKLDLWENRGENDHYYHFIPLGEGWYKIAFRQNGRLVLDVSGGQNGNRVAIQASEDNDALAQRFRFRRTSEGFYKIYTYWGRTIATQRNDAQDGLVHTWDDLPEGHPHSKNELWRLIGPQ